MVKDIHRTQNPAVIRTVILTALLVATSLAAIPAQAQQNSSTEAGFGLRAGLSLKPDQFVIGGGFSWGQKYGIFRLAPSVDVGFGDDLTTIAFNGDLLIKLKVEGSDFGFYGGGGPTVLYADPDGGSSDWNLGLSLVAGAHLPLRRLPLNLEARFGIGDIADFRALLVLEF